MPKPEIQWFHNEQIMLPTKDIVFHFDESTGTAILLIVDAFLEHAGQYSCKARNSAGEAACTATLTVIAEGKAPFLFKGIQFVAYHTFTLLLMTSFLISHLLISS